MTKLALADSFGARYQQLKHSLPQGILLHGEPGIGLGSLARDLGGNHARVFQPATKQGDLDQEHGTITVEAIRDLYEQTRAKSTSQQVIIIESADRMSLSAQNAFLKLLEEPSSSIRFILTSHRKDVLLPTILSRVQEFYVPRISNQQSKRLLKEYHLTDTEKRQVEFLADGRPGLLHRLASDSEMRQSAAAMMSDAREFLRLPNSYPSLVIAHKYAGNRQQAESFVDALMNVLKHSLYTAPQVSLMIKSEQIAQAKTNLATNANPKLQLLKLVLS